MAAGDWEELVYDALVEIGVKEAGEALDADERLDGFRRCVGMLAEWGLKGLLVPGKQQVAHTVTESKATFTIGPAAADPAPSPDIELNYPVVDIYALTYKRVGQQQFWPIEKTSYSVLVETRQLYSNNPRRYVYETNHPLATLLFDRTTVVDDQFAVTFGGHFPAVVIGDQTTDILPHGFREGVMQNLAIKLAPSFGAKVGRGQGLSDVTVEEAREAKKEIRRWNAGLIEAKIDPALRQGSTSMLSRRRGSYLR